MVLRASRNYFNVVSYLYLKTLAVFFSFKTQYSYFPKINGKNYFDKNSFLMKRKILSGTMALIASW